LFTGLLVTLAAHKTVPKQETGVLSREAILRKLEPIFRSVIDPDLVLSEELDGSKVPLWDSLKHIILMVEIEMQLGVALTTDELAHLRNVSELVTLLQQKGVQA
jgi:acyl carrier protein